eukprot:669203_1
MSQQGPPMLQQGKQIQRQGPPMQQRGPPMLQHGTPMQQQVQPMYQKYTQTCQQGPPIRQQGPPIRQQGPPIRQQGPPIRQQGPPIRQQGPPIRQQGPQIRQQGPQIRQQGQSIRQQGRSMNQPGRSMNQPGKPMQKRGPPMHQQGRPMFKQNSQMKQQSTNRNPDRARNFPRREQSKNKNARNQKDSRKRKNPGDGSKLPFGRKNKRMKPEEELASRLLESLGPLKTKEQVDAYKKNRKSGFPVRGQAQSEKTQPAEISLPSQKKKKKKYCRFFMSRGKCTKGDECSFVHDIEARRERVRKKRKHNKGGRPVSLFEKLMGKDMPEDHEIILDCLRFMKDENYFLEPEKTSSISSTKPESDGSPSAKHELNRVGVQVPKLNQISLHVQTQVTSQVLNLNRMGLQVPTLNRMVL